MINNKSISFASSTSSTTKQKLIIIGGGMSGTKFATEIAERTDAYEIFIFNKESHVGYNRIMLSPVLAGEKSFDDILIHPMDWYRENHIQLHLNKAVTHIDSEAQCVHVGDEQFAYDKLVIATGSTPFILPLPNHQAEGVVGFRDKKDVDKMLRYAQSSDKNNCIVIGGGLLGLEAANALVNHGAHVNLVHIADSILERQLNTDAAQLLQNHFEEKGINFHLNAFSDAITVDENNQVTGLSLKDGTHIPADIIVMTVGVRPNITLAQSSDIPCERGILVNEYMHTHVENIYALGECVQFGEHLFGLVAPTYEQAYVLAEQLIPHAKKMCEFGIKPTATKLKVSGIDLFSAGDITPNDNYHYLEYKDLSQKIYKRITLENNHIVGVVLYGDVLDGAWFFELMQAKTDIQSIRHNLLFGQAFCHTSEENEESIASKVSDNSAQAVTTNINPPQPATEQGA